MSSSGRTSTRACGRDRAPVNPTTTASCAEVCRSFIHARVPLRYVWSSPLITSPSTPIPGSVSYQVAASSASSVIGTA